MRRRLSVSLLTAISSVVLIVHYFYGGKWLKLAGSD